MPRPCQCCNHPAREAIEAEIISGRSIRSVANAYGLRPAGLHRHLQNHLPQTLRAAAQEQLAQIDARNAAQSEARSQLRSRRAIQIEDTPPPQPEMAVAHETQAAPAPSTRQNAPNITNPVETPLGLLALAHSLRDRALAILERAEAAGDEKTALAAIREARGVLESLSRLEPSGAEHNFTFTQNAEWQQVRSVILTALADYPDARLAVAEALARQGALS